MPVNLWPDQFTELKERTPISIMREQAHALGERTANIVLGKVEAAGMVGPNKLAYSFIVYCPPLGHRIGLFTFYHDFNLYPVTIQVTGHNKTFSATNPEELQDSLKEIFSLDFTKQMVASLIAQSKV
jgi:hypothetical protein